MHKIGGQRFSVASEQSAYYSARSSSPSSRMDLEEPQCSREDEFFGPRRKKPRLSHRGFHGKRSLSSTPPSSSSKRSRSSLEAQLGSLTVKELKDRMQGLGLNFVGLVEKAELVTRLQAHLESKFVENRPQNTARVFVRAAAPTTAASTQTTKPGTPCMSARPRPPAACGTTAAAAARTDRKSRGMEEAEIARVENILARDGSYREVLGLSPRYTAEEISSVTRKLYRAVHPDKVPPHLKERATMAFDAVRKAESEAVRQQERRLKVRPPGVSAMKASFDRIQQVVTVKWHMVDNISSVARPDRFELAAGNHGFRVEQGSISSSSSGDGGWYEFSLSSVSRKGNDQLFASRAFHFYISPANEAGFGPESKVLVSMTDDMKESPVASLSRFAGLSGFIRRHNTASF